MPVDPGSRAGEPVGIAGPDRYRLMRPRARATGACGCERIGHHGEMPSPDPREVFADLPFPFPNDEFPPNLGAVIQRTVFSGELPAREVIHDEDNKWLVGDGINDPNAPGACIVGHIRHVVELNSSVASLASLPPGHLAFRQGPGKPWEIEVHRYEDEE